MVRIRIGGKMYHHRRSIRLAGYDYTEKGAYFVTICVYDPCGWGKGRPQGVARTMLGRILDGGVELNEAGRMVQAVWREIPRFYPGFEIDEFIIMPDHIHGIIHIVGATPRGRPTTPISLGDLIGRFKTLTTRRYVEGVHAKGWPPFERSLWQRNYYERIIRDDDELARIRAYIRNNPCPDRGLIKKVPE